MLCKSVVRLHRTSCIYITALLTTVTVKTDLSTCFLHGLVGDSGQVLGVHHAGLGHLTRMHIFTIKVIQCRRQDISTVALCGTELWVVYRGEVGVAMHPSSCEWAPPVDKLWIFFFALILVQWKLSILRAVDKHEPSLTLRVALNKSYPRLIWNTMVFRTITAVSV